MKEGHIYLFGEFDNYQSPDAEHWGCISVTTVANQVQAQINQGAEKLIVHIHSNGGNVDEGFAVADYFNSLSIPVDTQVDGVCRSIATVVLLVGENRVMGENSEVLIHNPWGAEMGDKDALRRYADDLERIENKISSYYEKHTQLSKTEALEYMKVETTFSSKEALEKGFITEIKSTSTAVARFNPNNNSKQMTKEEFEKEFDKKSNSFFESIKNLFKPKDTKNLIVQDANGGDVDFTDLNQGDTPKVGDKATIGGSPANGDVVMPSGETYVFTNGELTEIKPKEAEGDSEEVANLKAEIERLKAQNSANASLKETHEAEIQNLKDSHATKLEEIESGVKDKLKEFRSTFNFTEKKKGNEVSPEKRFGVKINPNN